MNWDTIVAWLKGFWQKDVVALVENEISGFSKMKANLESHIQAAEAQFQKAEDEIKKKKDELEAKMKEIEAQIAAEVSKQTLITGAKEKAQTVISNIDTFMNEKISKAA